MSSNRNRKMIDRRLYDGIRSRTPRDFNAGMPTILPINLDVLKRNTNRTIEDLPDTIRLNTANYKLFAVTMGNGGHFISALSLEKQLCSNPGWYIYDGLSEYRRKVKVCICLFQVGL